MIGCPLMPGPLPVPEASEGLPFGRPSARASCLPLHPTLNKLCGSGVLNPTVSQDRSFEPAGNRTCAPAPGPFPGPPLPPSSQVNPHLHPKPWTPAPPPRGRPTGHAPRGQRGAGSAAPRLYLSGARPPRTGSGGHLAVAGDTAEGRSRRTGRAFRSRRRTFLREVPRLGAGAAGRGGESGVPGRSRSAPPLHNMASSASSSAAGAEGTPPAQVDYGSYYLQSSRKKLSSLATTSLIRQQPSASR
ncbi:translation initiation factor IF-2-like [Bubalus bubalis]|uniref:translation initiation factor IF-2-like n=1 Tax=Bubalus bubalis TaxID=89462 RepID=UPI001E1B9AAB|nr:translation initiation factor IF-2-like [Bubalus bubalis]